MGVVEFGYLVATLLVGVLATVGYGVMSLTPPEVIIARRCFWGAAIIFAGIGIVWGVTTPESIWIRLPVVCIVSGIAIGGLTEGLRWVKNRIPAAIELPAEVPEPVRPPAHEPAPAVVETGPQSLMELFKTDFDRTLRTNSELTLTSPQDAAFAEKISIQIYNDMDTGTYFIGFYIPSSPRTVDTIRYLSDGYLSPTLQLRQGVEITSRDPADMTPLKFSDFNFSRRIYVYHESELTIQEIAALDTLYRTKNLILQLRGNQYRTTRWLQKSHGKN